MSKLKEQLLEVVSSAIELALDCSQTLEVRAAVKQLQQAKGSISQMQHEEESSLTEAIDLLATGKVDDEEE